MKKQGFLHLHGLMKEIANYFKDRGESPDLEEYQEMDISPTSIHNSKDEHKKAVFALAYGINSEENIQQKLHEIVSEKPKVRWQTAKRLLEEEAETVDEDYAEVELEDVWKELGRAPEETLRELEERGCLVQVETPPGETEYSPDTKVYLRS